MVPRFVAREKSPAQSERVEGKDWVADRMMLRKTQ